MRLKIWIRCFYFFCENKKVLWNLRNFRLILFFFFFSLKIFLIMPCPCALECRKLSGLKLWFFPHLLAEYRFAGSSLQWADHFSFHYSLGAKNFRCVLFFATHFHLSLLQTANGNGPVIADRVKLLAISKKYFFFSIYFKLNWFVIYLVISAIFTRTS